MILTGVKLIRLEYEVGNNQFKTTIALGKGEDIIQFMRDNIREEFRITMSEDLGPLMALTSNVVSVIVKARVGDKKEEVLAPKKRRRGRTKTTDENRVT